MVWSLNCILAFSRFVLSIFHYSTSSFLHCPGQLPGSVFRLSILNLTRFCASSAVELLALILVFNCYFLRALPENVFQIGCIMYITLADEATSMLGTISNIQYCYHCTKQIYNIYIFQRSVVFKEKEIRYSQE